MKPYKVLKHPNQKLKEIAAPVEKFDDRLREKIIRMITTMKREGGIGLAANQVGILERIIVIDTLKSDKTNGFLGALINPVISARSEEKNTGLEGCLSFPDKTYNVSRSEYIIVQFQNPLGTVQQKKFTGMTAVCIQHEVDHLNGITFDTKGTDGR